MGIQMKKFMAASGREVLAGEDGSLMFGKAIGYLSREAVFDAEEYFHAKRDADLGRWRDPFEPTYIVYYWPDTDRVTVTDETNGSSRVYERDIVQAVRRSVGADVAARYFGSHPERKPWHEAKHGEVWAVTETNGEALYRVTSDGRFEQVSGDNGLLSMPITHDSITAAERVWPAGF